MPDPFMTLLSDPFMTFMTDPFMTFNNSCLTLLTGLTLDFAGLTLDFDLFDLTLDSWLTQKRASSLLDPSIK